MGEFRQVRSDIALRSRGSSLTGSTWPSSTLSQPTHPAASTSARAIASVADAVSFTRVFVETPFSGEPRHARRLEMITDYEKTAELPPLPAQG